MAVTKEFRCLAHGPFDAAEAICPHGCTVVVREFRTAPGGRSEKTKASDRALEHLAKKYNLSDMSNKNGSVAASKRQPTGMEPVWGEMPKGNVFQPGKGEVARDADGHMQRVDSTGGAAAALAGMGMTGSVAEILAKQKGLDGLPAEPGFMEIAKGLPKPRPHAVGQYGNAGDLEKAIKSA